MFKRFVWISITIFFLQACKTTQSGSKAAQLLDDSSQFVTKTNEVEFQQNGKTFSLQLAHKSPSDSTNVLIIRYNGQAHVLYAALPNNLTLWADSSVDTVESDQLFRVKNLVRAELVPLGRSFTFENVDIIAFEAADFTFDRMNLFQKLFRVGLASSRGRTFVQQMKTTKVDDIKGKSNAVVDGACNYSFTFDPLTDVLDVKLAIEGISEKFEYSIFKLTGVSPHSPYEVFIEQSPFSPNYKRLSVFPGVSFDAKKNVLSINQNLTGNVEYADGCGTRPGFCMGYAMYIQLDESLSKVSSLFFTRRNTNYVKNGFDNEKFFQVLCE